MEEIWKDISGYENRYQISNLGRVKSLARRTNTGNYVTERILKQRIGTKGYLHVNLFSNGAQRTIETHRLVAISFVENPNDLNIINHKDECKTNNQADNLEWCTLLYNNTYGSAVTKRMKRIAQLNMRGEVIQYWRSAADIQRELGFNKGDVGGCARGEHSKAYGYRWAFA